MFALDRDEAIDATFHGGIARFINHRYISRSVYLLDDITFCLQLRSELFGESDLVRIGETYRLIREQTVSALLRGVTIEM